MSALEYRPDIDGLRTFAVVPVILFHAGAEWMPGGFVGVDVFFVISGYLISSIILRETAAGEFSFLRFYERRLRRIIPALLAMVLVTIAVFQVIGLPDQAQGASESGIAALLAVSNFYFWSHSGYFAPAAEFMPLLHTWSLGVEEQFYFVFPIVLLLIFKLRLPLRPILLLGTVAAFGVSVWLSETRPSVAYYLLPARAWELALGAVLAARIIPPLKGGASKEVVPVVGLSLILFSLVHIRSDMIFPGWVALLPCIGAGMVIYAGGQSWVARNILAARPLVLIGLMSYSLYLWHWPVLAALRVRTASVHLDTWLAAAAVLLTLGVAWVSWRYVEQLFRDRRVMSTRRAVKYLGTGSAIAVALASVSVATGGFPARLDESARVALAAAGDVDPLRFHCLEFLSRDACKFGSSERPVTYAIIGDSHAAAIRPAVEASGLMGETNGTLYWTGACPFLEGATLLNHPERTRCAEFKANIWEALERDGDIDTVVLAGRWPFQITGWLPESGGSNRMWLVDNETTSPSIEENERVFARSLKRTLERLAAMEISVIIVGSVPEPGFDVPRTVALARHGGFQEPRGISRSSVEERAAKADRVIAKVIENVQGVRLISLWDAFCGPDWCNISRDHVLIYYDDDHLSYNGAIAVASPAIRRFAESGSLIDN